MRTLLNINMVAVISCVIELGLVKYGQFAFGGILAIAGIFGALAWLMGHKNLGRGMVLGLIFFSIILLLFGYYFMEGWLSPQDYFKGKKPVK